MSVIIIFQSIYYSKLFENMVEVLIPFIQLLLFIESKGVLSLECGLIIEGCCGFQKYIFLVS